MKTILALTALCCILPAMGQHRFRDRHFGGDDFDFDGFGEPYGRYGPYGPYGGRREQQQCPKNPKANEYCTPIPRPGYEDARAERVMSDFAWKLFQATSKQGVEENFALCPVSPQILLTYLNWAANGTTKQELNNAVKFSNTKSIERAVGYLSSNDEYKGKKIKELEIATAFFFAEDLSLNSIFDQAARGKVDVKRVNFGTNQADVAFKDWIKEKTRDLIKVSSNFDSNTRLALASAIYFKAKWLFEFEPAMPSKFTKLDGTVVQIPMMHQQNRQYKFGEIKDLATWLAIPYRSDEAMVFIMPDDGFNVDDVINRLDTNKFNDIMTGVAEEENEFRVNLTIPKFKIDTSSSLIEPLQKLGVKKLFEAGADLGYMTKERVYVSEVKQQTSIDVNEEGTVLVSATKILAVGLSVQRRLDRVTFVVDKPFIAMIVNTAQNVPYVLCKVTDPKY